MVKGHEHGFAVDGGLHHAALAAAVAEHVRVYSVVLPESSWLTNSSMDLSVVWVGGKCPGRSVDAAQYLYVCTISVKEDYLDQLGEPMGVNKSGLVGRAGR